MTFQKAVFLLHVLILFAVSHGLSTCPSLLPTDFPLVRDSSNVTFEGNQARQMVTPSNNTSGKIVGGQQSSGVLEDYVVQIYWNGQFICTASLLNERYVLSAAQCEPYDLEGTVVWFYTPELGDWFTPREVSRAIVHPAYDPSSSSKGRDIMMLVLKEDAPINARFVTVNIYKNIPNANAITRTAGFGVTRENGNIDMILRQVDVPARSKWSCKSLESSYKHKQHICAAYLCGGCDSCAGDGGGPLFQFDSDGYVYQVGIVSYGTGCARPNNPGVYTRLSTHEKWITNNIGDYYYFVGGFVPQIKVGHGACP